MHQEVYEKLDNDIKFDLLTYNSTEKSMFWNENIKWMRPLTDLEYQFCYSIYLEDIFEAYPLYSGYLENGDRFEISINTYDMEYLFSNYYDKCEFSTPEWKDMQLYIISTYDFYCND